MTLLNIEPVMQFTSPRCRTNPIALQFVGMRGLVLAHKLPGLVQKLILRLESIAVMDVSVEERVAMVEQCKESFKQATAKEI